MQIVALCKVGAELAERFKLLGCLDALGHDLAAHFMTERNESGCEGMASAIPVDVARQAHVELDDVGLNIEDMPQSCITGPGIIEGDSRFCPQRLERPLETINVADDRVLGDLQHHSPLRDILKDACQPASENQIG